MVEEYGGGKLFTYDRGESERGWKLYSQHPLQEQACSDLETLPPTRPHLLTVTPPGSTIMRTLVVLPRPACLYPEPFNSSKSQSNLVISERGSHCTAQAGHKLTEIYGSLSPECWD